MLRCFSQKSLEAHNFGPVPTRYLTHALPRPQPEERSGTRQQPVPLPRPADDGNTDLMLKHLSPAFALFLFSATASAQDVHIVPTEMCRDYFFVPLVMAEREDRAEDEAGRTLWFLFDTGAAVTHVDPDAIERITGRDVRDNRRIAITDAHSGPVSFNRLPARVSELDHLSVALGREIDGILGFTAFEDFLLTLDYGVSEMRIESGTLPRPDNDTVFNASGPDNRPWIRLRLPGRSRRVLIDSGAAATPLALNRIERYPLTAEARAIGASIRFRHIEYRQGGRLNGEATFGDVVFDQPLVEEVPGTELLGGMMMRHFVWTFDQDNERVRVERIDGEGSIPMDAEITHGLALRPVGDHVRIEHILDGSRAGAAGLQVGDIITHLDALPMRTRGCGTDDDTPDSVVMTRLRDGETVDVVLPLVTLVD